MWLLLACQSPKESASLQESADQQESAPDSELPESTPDSPTDSPTDSPADSPDSDAECVPVRVENVRLWNDDMVADFCGSCTEVVIDGDLKIDSWVTELGPLSCLVEVTQSVNIYQADISSLRGLENLRSVGIGFQVYNNARLVSLAGTSGLTRVPGSLGIYFNDALPTFDGFENVTFTDYLAIGGNDVLADFSGLGSLEEINSAQITDNANIDFSGFESLRRVNGDFTVASTGEQRSYRGLSSLEYIGGNVSLNNNNSTFEGLDALEYVGGSLELVSQSATDLTGLSGLTWAASVVIQDNERLESLVGMGSLESTPDLLVARNPALVSVAGLDSLVSVGRLNLTECSMQSLAGLEGVAVAGEVRITDNAALQSISGLDATVGLSADLAILDNPVLVSVELSGLESVDLNMSVEDNVLLTALDLPALGSVGQDVRIMGNSSLSAEVVDGLLGQVVVGGTTTVRSNGP